MKNKEIEATVKEATISILEHHTNRLLSTDYISAI